MCKCKNSGCEFVGCEQHSELTICPSCEMDADMFIEWVGNQSVDTPYEYELDRKSPMEWLDAMSYDKLDWLGV